MKKRILTSIAIILVIALSFVLKMTITGGDYFFDALIILVTCFAAFECSKLLKAMDRPNYKYLVIAFPIIIYINHLLAFLFDSSIGLAWTLIIDVCLIILMFAITFVYGLITSKSIKKELRIKKITDITPSKVAFNRAINTTLAFIYPTFLLMFTTLINHFADLSTTFSGISAQHAKIFSFTALLFMLVIPAITDTFAFLVGGAIGGKKLCPKISPNKTIAGAVGGLVFSVIISVVTFLILNAIPSVNVAFTAIGFKVWQVVIFSIILSCIAELGDLFESFIKRKANVKDSGKILPGHGGILDRCDSYIFVAPVLMLCFSIILLCV